MLAGPLLDGYF